MERFCLFCFFLMLILFAFWRLFHKIYSLSLAHKELFWNHSFVDETNVPINVGWLIPAFVPNQTARLSLDYFYKCWWPQAPLLSPADKRWCREMLKGKKQSPRDGENLWPGYTDDKVLFTPITTTLISPLGWRSCPLFWNVLQNSPLPPWCLFSCCSCQWQGYSLSSLEPSGHIWNCDGSSENGSLGRGLANPPLAAVLRGSQLTKTQLPK